MNSTIIAIKEKYYWFGLNKDVKDYVKLCHVCQMTATLPPQPQKKLHPIPPPDRPWAHIGIDLICDLPVNSLGYKHVLVATCYLTKFTAARPLQTKTSKEVLLQLEDIYFILGVPKIIQHDQGPEFRSQEFSAFHKRLKVDNRSTAAYHPQSNGLVESHNKFSKQNESHDSDTTQFHTTYDLHNCSPDFLESIEEERKISREEAQRNILCEQLRQKGIFDKKVNKNRSEINEGDMILYRNMPKSKKMPGTKNQNKYVGPIIAHEVTDTHVIIKQENGSKRKKVPIDIARVYHPRLDIITDECGKKKIDSETSLMPLKNQKEIKSFEGSEKWVYGIEKQLMMDKLENFRILFKEHINKGTYFSELHKRLEEEFRKKGVYVPNTFIFDFLKDITVENMRREVLYNLLDLSKDVFPEVEPSRTSDYVFKVLYGVAIEFLENNLIDVPIDDSIFGLFHLSSEESIISYPSIEWQKNKCLLLEIPFTTNIEQHSH